MRKLCQLNHYRLSQKQKPITREEVRGQKSPKFDSVDSTVDDRDRGEGRELRYGGFHRNVQSGVVEETVQIVVGNEE